MPNETDSAPAPSESQRLDAFVDAAFAFAVSLLIIAGAEPLKSFDDLGRALLRIPAFAGGFGLIILFWLAHRSWSALGPRRDATATALSLAVVFSVMVFVFPLRLLMETATHFVSGGRLPGRGVITSLDQLGWVYLIYGLGFSILSVLFVLLFRQAARTVDPTDRARVASARDWMWSWVLAAATGVISSLLALTPLLAAAPWLPGTAYWLIPAGRIVMARLGRQRAAPV